MFLNNLSKTLIPFVSIILIVPTLFIPTLANNSNLEVTKPEITGSFDISSSEFYWPVPRLY